MSDSASAVLPPPVRFEEKVVLTPAPGQVIVERGGVVHAVGKTSEAGHTGTRQLAANVEGSSADLAWPALTCILEDCPGEGKDGQPFLFFFKVPGTRIDEYGNIVWPKVARKERDRKLLCPACGRLKGIRSYEPPEVKKRKEELAEELRRSRAAFQAVREGRLNTMEHRTPTEIMKDMEDLPIVYLAEED